MVYRYEVDALTTIDHAPVTAK